MRNHTRPPFLQDHLAFEVRKQKNPHGWNIMKLFFCQNVCFQNSSPIHRTAVDTPLVRATLPGSMDILRFFGRIVGWERDQGGVVGCKHGVREPPICQTLEVLLPGIDDHGGCKITTNGRTILCFRLIWTNWIEMVALISRMFTPFWTVMNQSSNYRFARGSFHAFVRDPHGPFDFRSAWILGQEVRNGRVVDYGSTAPCVS